MTIFSNFMITTMKKFLSFICIFGLGLSVHAQTPVLKFPEGITWKAVFDSGLRPKHVSGLEEVISECVDQELIVFIGDEAKPFKLDSGRLSIELRHDDQVRLFEHISRVPITMEEGKRRQDHFRSLFQAHLTRTGSMPVVMDEKSGAVMATSDNSVTARIKNLRISFGFTPSFQKAKPLIPTLMISTHPAPGESSPPIRRKIVEPPAGYEWYSLDPKVHTPDPSGVVNAAALPESHSTQSPESTRPERREKSPDSTPPQATKSPWPVWIVLLALLFPIGLLLKRRFSKE
jgi:hypothetical protein